MEVIIGRKDGTNQLSLKVGNKVSIKGPQQSVNNGVSREHCKLTVNDDGTFTIENLKAENQTLVNGLPIASKRITPNDVVELGWQRYRLDWNLVFEVIPKMVNISIFEVLGSSNSQHLGTFGGVKEFAVLIQEFQSIPLTWVVACGKDYASAGTLLRYSYFGCRSGCKSDVHDIEAHSHQGAAYHILHHLARDACITAHYNLIARNLCGFADKCCVGRYELNYV